MCKNKTKEHRSRPVMSVCRCDSVWCLMVYFDFSCLYVKCQIKSARQEPITHAHVWLDFWLINDFKKRPRHDNIKISYDKELFCPFILYDACIPIMHREMAVSWCGNVVFVRTSVTKKGSLVEKILTILTRAFKSRPASQWWMLWKCFCFNSIIIMWYMQL